MGYNNILKKGGINTSAEAVLKRYASKAADDIIVGTPQLTLPEIEVLQKSKAGRFIRDLVMRVGQTMVGKRYKATEEISRLAKENLNLSWKAVKNWTASAIESDLNMRLQGEFNRQRDTLKLIKPIGTPKMVVPNLQRTPSLIREGELYRGRNKDKTYRSLDWAGFTDGFVPQLMMSLETKSQDVTNVKMGGDDMRTTTIQRRIISDKSMAMKTGLVVGQSTVQFVGEGRVPKEEIDAWVKYLLQFTNFKISGKNTGFYVDVDEGRLRKDFENIHKALWAQIAVTHVDTRFMRASDIYKTVLKQLGINGFEVGKPLPETMVKFYGSQINTNYDDIMRRLKELTAGLEGEIPKEEEYNRLVDKLMNDAVNSGASLTVKGKNSIPDFFS